MGADCTAGGSGGTELDYRNDEKPDELRQKFIEAGQGHIFNGWGDMTDEEKKTFVQQCSQFDVNLINQLFENLVMRPQSAAEDTAANFETVEPESILDKPSLSPVDKSTYTSLGQQQIKEGRVGVVILAGGQGSRLGFSGPKGKFDIGLPSGKTLFQILTERFFKAQMDAHQITASSDEQPDGTSVPVIPAEAQTCKMFVMTSHENHEETVNFFRENCYFGGKEDSFVFFPQAMLPAVDTAGKIMLDSYCTVKLAPNGNGALFDSLRNHEELQREIAGFEYVQIIGVDNALNKVLDPIQIGFTHSRGLQTSLKAVAKRDAQEKVGVIGKKNGAYNIVEYSELPPAMAGERSADDHSLKFNHGHILVFVVRSDFLMRLATGSQDQSNSLYHKAHKKITHCDPETMSEILPTEENGWKFELFVHGFLPMVETGKLGIVMVDRADEFAPVKNADGPKQTAYGYAAEPLPDTPAYTRRMILAEATRWLTAAEADGLRIDPATKGHIEVSFLLSYAGENLNWLKRVHKKAALGGASGYLDHEGEYTEKEVAE